MFVSSKTRAASRALWEGVQARPSQIEPSGDWAWWLILSGRGWGKTRTGAEWIVWQAVANPDTRWAIVAPTFADARDTCVEGVSGIRMVLDRYEMVEKWNRSLGEVRLKNNSRIKLFSADEPDRLRGPQHHGAWIDEMAAWRYMDETWDQLRFGLRLGERPQTVITTTPRPRKLIRELAADPRTYVTRGSTFDNAANLSEAALADLRARYEGSRLGRQELHGELVDDVEGALWTMAMIDAARVAENPPLERIIVAIDPAVTVSEDSDLTGIVTVGVANGQYYVLGDLSMKGSPEQWARAAVEEYHAAAGDLIVAEVNNGGDMVASVLRTVDPNVPVRKVTATRGKQVRAQPISALYEQGRVHHVGYFPELEEQLTTWTPDDPKSPDRLDALVWGLTSLVTRPVRAVQSFGT